MMMSGHIYYQSENMLDSASQFDDSWLCPVLNGVKGKEVPKSICSALHSSELEANKMSVSDEEKISDLEDKSDGNCPEAIDEIEVKRGDVGRTLKNIEFLINTISETFSLSEDTEYSRVLLNYLKRMANTDETC